VSEMNNKKKIKYGSFNEFLLKNFPENKFTPIKLKKSSNPNSNEKHFSVQQRIEKIKEEQIKILSGITKKVEKTGNGKSLKTSK